MLGPQDENTHKSSSSLNRAHTVCFTLIFTGSHWRLTKKSRKLHDAMIKILPSDPNSLSHHGERLIERSHLLQGKLIYK